MIPNHLSMLLPGALIVAVVGLWSAVISVDPKEPAAVQLSPTQATTIVGEPFFVEVVVSSDVPANAFRGLIEYDHSVLQVAAIDYNTSIADLWVDKPWYENGDGTINFAGGTTKPGGFTGSGTLMKIAFIPTAAGEALVAINKAGVYAHNGFGSALELEPSIDAHFLDESLSKDAARLGQAGGNSGSQVAVLDNAPSYDLDGDGAVTIRDISIFMPKLFSNEARFDFNLDGTVDLKDFSILLDKLKNGA